VTRFIRHISLVVSYAALVMLSAPLAQAQSTTAVPTQTPRYVDRDGVGIDGLIEIALARAPSLQGARARIDVARGRLTQAGLRPNPTVSTERRTEVGGTDNQSSAMLQWPLDLFRRSGRVHEAERTIEVSRHQADDAARLLAADVRLQAGRLLAAARQLEVVSQLAAAMKQAHELLVARVAEGAAPPIERDLAFVEWRRIEAEAHRLRGNADAALAQLKALVGLDPISPLVLREGLESVVLREQDDSTAAPDGPSTAAAEQRADVRVAQASVAQAASQVDRARRDGRFDVSLFGGYMRMDAGFPQLGFNESGDLTRIRGVFHNVAVGAVVTLPWLNRNQGAVASAEAERRAAEHEQAARTLAARADIAAARARAEAARRALAVYTSGLREVSRRNLDVIRESYQLGRVSLFDVIAEQRRHLETEMAYGEALANAFEARTALTRALDISKGPGAASPGVLP
jgi:outer membrane protein, heavy metal efflux system